MKLRPGPSLSTSSYWHPRTVTDAFFLYFLKNGYLTVMWKRTFSLLIHLLIKVKLFGSAQTIFKRFSKNKEKFLRQFQLFLQTGLTYRPVSWLRNQTWHLIRHAKWSEARIHRGAKIIRKFKVQNGLDEKNWGAKHNSRKLMSCTVSR